jgi:diadenosine tetraphosphate (Ap4A) HIT family hydrolase
MLIFKKHIPDFFRLAPSELLASLGEIKRCEIAIRQAFGAKLMNYLFMGNRAGHVHLHLVPRYESDPNFGSSPFLETNRAVEPRLTESQYRKIAEKIRKNIK